jgi:2-isopropylmalate synthase
MSRAESPATGTGVLIGSTDGARTWSTMGVSENIVEGSGHALSDSIVDGLLHAENQE